MTFSIIDVDGDDTILDGQQNVVITLSGDVAASGKRVFLSQPGSTVEQEVVNENATSITFNCSFGGVLSSGPCNIRVSRPDANPPVDGEVIWTRNGESGVFDLAIVPSTIAPRCTLSTEQTRQGIYAYKHDLRRADFEPGGISEGNKPRVQSNRNELLALGEEGWWGASLYVPANHETEDIAYYWQSEILLQLHGTGESNFSPPFSIAFTALSNRNANGGILDRFVLGVSNKTGSGNATGGDTTNYGYILAECDYTYGKWTDVVWRIIPAQDNTGILEVWVDGVKKVAVSGRPTTYWGPNDPPAVNNMYMTWGPYKSSWADSATSVFNDRVYHYDNLRYFKGQNGYDIVDPSNPANHA